MAARPEKIARVAIAARRGVLNIFIMNLLSGRAGCTPDGL
jgi:hypothetical protein